MKKLILSKVAGYIFLKMNFKDFEWKFHLSNFRKPNIHEKFIQLYNFIHEKFSNFKKNLTIDAYCLVSFNFIFS